MLACLLKPLAWVPLSWLHAAGAFLGRLVYCLSRAYSARLDENLRQGGLYLNTDDFDRLRRAAIAEAGKTAIEVIAVWLSSPERLRGLVKEVPDLRLIEQAREAGRGILFLTPHLGCFEITPFYFGQALPLTVLYRRPRARWLEPLMVRGRKRGRIQLAPTDLGGVRRLLRALRRGEAVGMLPDQAPRVGEGAWAPFFGRPAFTMTLAARLQQATGCAAFMVVAERLPKGAGYRMHVEALREGIKDEVTLNRAVEAAIRLRPEQYLWGYNRYKLPRKVPPGSDQSELSVSRADSHE